MIKDTSKIHGVNWLAVRVQRSVQWNLKIANNNSIYSCILGNFASFLPLADFFQN